MRTALFICVVAAGLFAADPAAAQFSGDMIGQNLSVTLDPQFPAPGETVTAMLDDYALGIIGSEIRWSIDGVEVSEAANQREITFTAGTVGESQTVAVSLALPGGGSLSAQSTIVPLYADVIVEPQTYTPVSYRGRALPTVGSLVYLTALIQDQNGLIDASQHTYSWYLNNKALGGGPIKGGYKTQFTVPFGQSNLITLVVSDQSGQTIVRRLVNIPSVELDVQFYEVSTLYGLSNQAIADTLPLFGNSAAIRAVPYYLDRLAVNGDLFTEWKINGQTQDLSHQDPFEVTLLRQGVGSSRIDFKIRNLSALIQSAESSFTVQY